MFLELQKDLVIWLQNFSNTFTDLFFNFISFLGEPEFYILVLGFLYWVFNKKAGEFVGITLGISLSINNILKGFFNLARPFQTYPDEIENFREYTATGSAFPSGHVQGATSLFFAVASYFNKKYLWWFAALIVVFMSISRMFLGVHYLQDTIAGGIVGILVVILVAAIFQKVSTNQALLHKIYFIIIALLLPFMFFIEVNDFFRGYGIYVGIVLGVIYEKKYVNFSMDVEVWKKVIRYILGVISMMIVMIVLGELFGLLGFEDESFGKNFFDFLRFFFIAFVGLGLYPKLFTKFNF